MISILIPVYNYDVEALVTALHKQAAILTEDSEIIIFDDGSQAEVNGKNELLNRLPHVQFRELKKNVGLSENRNLLAAEAQYENLLFIDGDSLVGENFLQNYLQALSENTEVIYGGRLHPKDFPDKSNLRWKYGTYVEDKTVEQRLKFPYRTTLFNNTLIRKKLFFEIGFEKELNKYGHEDSLFSYELKKRKAAVLHISNPVIHNDIDSNAVFLEKTISGLNNLNFLYKRNKIDADFIKLLSVHGRFKKYKLANLIGRFYLLLEKPMRSNLLSKKPSLFVFNLFRLTYFCKIAS